MAANQTAVALDLAGMIVNETGKLMNAIEELENVYEWATDAGIVFTNYETEIEESGSLQHAIGANYNQVAGIILPALIAWLETQTIGSGPLSGKSYKEALQMLRRNGS
jgi:hypothetical protein